MPTRDVFSRYLNGRRTIQGMDFSIREDAISRLQLFNLSGMDYQGQVSSGYGQRGGEVGIGISIDLTDFLLPLIPLPIHVDVKVKLGGILLKEQLVLIQRYPKVSYIYPYPYPYTPVVVWNTDKPLCLLGLEGYSGSVSLDLGIGASIEIPFPSIQDELELEVSAKVGGNAIFTGKMIRMKGEYTGSFPSPSDISLRTDANLEKVVDLLFGKPDKRKLKEEIDAWIRDMVTKWLTARQPVEKASGVRRVFGKAAEFTKDHLKRIPYERVSTAVGNLLNDLIFSRVNLEIRLPIFNILLRKWEERRSRFILIDDLRFLKFEIQRNTNTRQMPAEEGVAALRQIQIYIDLLLKCNARLNPIPVLSKGSGAFFNLCSFAAEAGASAAAVAAANINLGPGEIFLTHLTIEASAEAKAMASAKVDIQRISHRYQSNISNGESLLYFTQDSWITYRRTNASAAAFAELSLEPLAVAHGAERKTELSYQSMTYLSSVLYWKPRRVEVGQLIIPEPGSGIRLGLSVATRRLIRYAKYIAGIRIGGGEPRKMERLAEKVSKSLKITILQFQEFITDSGLKDLNETQEGFPKHVYLESAFPLPSNFRPILIQEKSGVFRPGTITKKLASDGFKRWEPMIESIRLRIRISDMETNVTPLFVLGFKVVIPKINIDLSMIKGAGQEGMFDYYVHWANPNFNRNIRLAKDAQESSIPPVVFLHQ